MKNTSSDSNVISTVENTETEVISASNTVEDAESEVISNSSQSIDTVSSGNQEVVISGEDISMYYKNGTRYEISISGDNISNSSIIFNINGYELHKILGG